MHSSTNFIIGGTLSAAITCFGLVAACCQTVAIYKRGEVTRESLKKNPFQLNEKYQWIYDTSMPFSYAFISLLFLGGMQHDFAAPFWWMLGLSGIMTLFYFCVGVTKSLRASTAADVEAADIYQDLSKPFVNMATMGFAQCILLAFFVLGLFQSGVPDFTSRTVFFYYFAGCVVQAMLIVQKEPSVLRFDASAMIFWIYAFRHAGGSFVEADKDDSKPITVSCSNLVVRFTLWTMVNVVGQTALIMTVPLLLCTSQTYMDFVLNAAASIFIIELDDCDSKSFRAVAPGKASAKVDIEG